MQKPIEQLLKKRKLNIQDLSAEEKATYDDWDRRLSESLTLENLKEFCVYQKNEIEKQYTSLDNSRDKDFILKATLSVYLAIIGLIDGDKAEKVALIQELEQLTKKQL